MLLGSDLCFTCMFSQVLESTPFKVWAQEESLLSPSLSVWLSIHWKPVLQVGDTITNAKIVEGQDYLVEPKGGPSSA